ncbi:zinc-ribbon domain-containing protein [Chloroflexota bacterium]
MSRSGGPTALTINIRQVPDGVMIQVGEQEWLGTAASMGQSALATLLNPINLLGRLDDIAQDISNLQLPERVWDSIENAVKQSGASTLLSDKLSRLTCDYCLTANEIGESSCIACGAPLGDMHPISCPNCGWVNSKTDKKCSKCGNKL